MSAAPSKPQADDPQVMLDAMRKIIDGGAATSIEVLNHGIAAGKLGLERTAMPDRLPEAMKGQWERGHRIGADTLNPDTAAQPANPELRNRKPRSKPRQWELENDLLGWGNDE